MEVLGIIPARGGSKAIPRKNIALLAGRPLINYTCKAAKKSKRLTRLIVSTDDKEIAQVCTKNNVEAPFLRPKDLAKDETGMMEVIIHALKTLEEAEKYKPDIIVLLQPTSPLRTHEHIDAAVDLLIKTGADSVVSVVHVPHQFNPVSVMKIENEKLIPFIESSQILRRQDKPKVYGRNGPAVLAMRREIILKKNSLYGDDIRPIIMSEEESVDIDTMFDFKIAEFLLKESQKPSHEI
ncbi:acylneuraminate cytidylyltransferase family protein [Candidatus Peregrinibacteria bacterium]|nr:acylneuraminate cytidylyltransferase family protein [Candidatus Peregrinibacteria bacterium]